MRKLFYIICLFILSVPGATAQLSEQIITDTMTLSQAKYALQQEIATINYYFYQERYGKEMKERFSRARSASQNAKAFELNNPDTIRYKLKNYNWKGSFSHNSRVGDSHIYYNYDINSYILSNAGSSAKRPNYKTFPKKVYYANGTIENSPEVLEEDAWYNNLKPIDSIEVAVKVFYPVKLETIKIPIEKGTYKQEAGGFIQVFDTEKYLDMGVTDNIYNQLTAIQCISTTGKRSSFFQNWGPQQPTTEMFNHVSKCYTLYSQLIKNIDEGKYKSVKKLKEECESAQPEAPEAQYIIRHAYQIPKDIQTIEYTYYANYDSIMIPLLMSYPNMPLQCDYAVVEDIKNKRIVRGVVDLDGKWIIKPAYSTIDEVAGVFFEVADIGNSTQLMRLNAKNRTFEKVDFELVENINNTFLIVSKENKTGVLSRNGNEIIPVKYPSVSHNEDMFIVRLNAKTPQYQVYNSDGKLVLPKTYRLIEIRNGMIVTTEITNDEEIITRYNKDGSRVK